MELKDIASVSGKSGLFAILKPTRAGVILESMDDKKQKLVVTGNYKVSILKDISIYTTSREGAVPLSEVLIAIHKKYKGTIPVDGSSRDADLYKFIGEVLPDYDSERVYTSDLKKLANWYKVLVQYAPEVLVEPKPEPEKKEAPEAKKTGKSEKEASEPEVKPKKTAAKKKA
jgi:hypothetical protein